MFDRALVALALGLAGCNTGNIVLDDVPSPDKAYHAVQFTSARAATVSGRYLVSILPGNGNHSATANVFEFDSNKEVASSKIQLKWIGPRHLTIVHDSRVRIFKKETSLGDVAVTYRPIAVN
jgi:hypothetical protein